MVNVPVSEPLKDFFLTNQLSNNLAVANVSNLSGSKLLQPLTGLQSELLSLLTTYKDVYFSEEKLMLYQLIVQSNLAKSNGSAKDLITGKAVKINNELIDDKYYFFHVKDLNNQEMKLSVGKKKHIIIQFTN